MTAKPWTAKDLGRELRKSAVLTVPEVALMRAARAMRERKGIYRDQYTPEERAILRRAQEIAIRCGQRRLWAYLLVMRRYGKLMVNLGQAVTHACPTCGRQHLVMRPKPTKEDREKEVRGLQAAARVVRARRKR